MHFLSSYTHIVNSRLKHIYLSFDNGGNLIIKSPKVPQAQIEKLLIKKASWINKSREKLHHKKGKPIDFLNPSELYVEGYAYPFKVETHSKKYMKLVFDVDCFTLFYQHYDEAKFQNHIDHFYKEKAQMCIPSLVEKWAKEMQLVPREIRFRKTKRQWGSCSGKNVLSFNTMMMKLPQDVIHYIIVHELAHIKHKHHQKSFWQFVEHYLPDYKIQVAELKNYTT